MKARQQSGPPNRWLLKILVVGFGILLVVLVELGCRALGWGEEDLNEDPFVGFSQLEPLFALNPLTNRYELRPERRLYFVSDGFPRFKDADTFRIFVLGGSTVQGRPYSIETAFPKWLQINLDLAFPSMNFEVVNCGGISYASYRLVPIMRECLDYQPDLIILCTGQNEFLEARTYGSIKNLAKPLGRPVQFVYNLASFKALHGLHRKAFKTDRPATIPGKPILKMEVDAFLDYRRGLEAYHRDHKWKSGVTAHFQENIRRMDALSQEAGIPLMILNPPVNLKDSPPFKSEHNPNLTEDQIEAYEDFILQANAHGRSDVRKEAQALQWATQLDPEFADTHYSLGQCFLKLNQIEKAKNHFTIALEEDICPLRMPPYLRRFLNDFCRKNKTPHLDLQELLLAHSQSPILGNEMLLDHVHPSIQGHQIIAEAVARLVADTYISQPEARDWEANRSKAYASHVSTLEALYFSWGDIRLKNLHAWTQGMTEGPPIEMHVPIDSK